MSDLGASLGAYLLSFTMLGTFWLAQHTLMNLATNTDRTFAWLQIGFLFVVTLLPFSASVLADYVGVPLVVGVYWLNILFLGVGLALSGVRLAVFRRRIVVAQVGYGLAALVCLLNTYASVAALAVVQLYFIVSPRIPGLDRLLQAGNRDALPQQRHPAGRPPAGQPASGATLSPRRTPVDPIRDQLGVALCQSPIRLPSESVQ